MDEYTINTNRQKPEEPANAEPPIGEPPREPAQAYAEVTRESAPAQTETGYTEPPRESAQAETGYAEPSQGYAYTGTGYTEPPREPAYAEPTYSEPTGKKRGRFRKAGIIVAISCSFLVAASAIGVTAAYMVSNVLPSLGRDEVTLTNGSPSAKVVNTTVETGEELTLAEISAKVGPAVVSILASASQTDPFGRNAVSTGTGSGIILTKDGYILTNNHVVSDSSELTVELSTGEKHTAAIIGTDSQTDLAVLKIDATDLPFVTLGDSSKLQVGDMAIAIGNPLGELTGTVTTGIISATDREITIDNEKMNLLQTDAAVNPGNSGGALVNAYGEVIGVVNAKTSALGVEGLGFAIPINDAKPVVTELIENGRVTGRAALGVSLQEVESDTAGFFNMNPGVYVAEVTQGGAAAEAGLQPGDRIMSADGSVVGTAADLKEIIEKHAAGDKLKITIDRDGSEMSLSVTLGSAD